MKKISRSNFLHESALAGAALVGSLAAPVAFAEETPVAAGGQPITALRSSPLTTTLQGARPSRRLWIWWRTSFK